MTVVSAIDAAVLPAAPLVTLIAVVVPAAGVVVPSAEPAAFPEVVPTAELT